MTLLLKQDPNGHFKSLVPGVKAVEISPLKNIYQALCSCERSDPNMRTDEEQ